MGKRFRWSRRRVVVAVVAAVAVVAVGASSASAMTPFTPEWDERARALQYWTELANPGDFDVKDMKVAAPSSVITATGSESPTRRVQEVNNWRPNPQAWVDAKARGAATSGLTTADIESTSRWKPRVAKFVGVAGGLALGAEVAFTLADDVLYPALGLPSTAAEDVFCVRHGNWFTDTMGMMLRNLDCGEWRLPLDYEALIAATEGVWSDSIIAGIGGYSVLGTVSSGGVLWRCYSAPISVSLPSYINWHQSLVSGGVVSGNPGSWVVSDSSTNSMKACLNKWPSAVLRVDAAGFHPRMWATDTRDGSIVADMYETMQHPDAEWITRVRCLDGSTRTAVSESFQQERLGAVAVPVEIALDGCQPVGVDMGIQSAGTGVAGGGRSWTTGTTTADETSQVSTSEVPTEVQDWMETYPQCMDGSCLLELKKEVAGGAELDCFEAPGECAEWQTDTAQGTATYRCYYAQVVVDLAECNVYGRTFVRENVQQGTAYSDPATGETVTTTTGTGTGTGTGTTVTTNPGAATVAMQSGARNPEQARQCWPTGWGALNPFEWVFQPVKCALEWAFVPRAAKVTQVSTQIRLAAMNSKPGLVAAAVGEWQHIAMPSGSGCSGPLVAFDVLGMNYSGYPLSACEEPTATWAAFSRIALTLVFAFGALYAITRYVGGVFGFRGVGGNEST